MTEVGFEPTQLSLPGLESGPLDRSGIRSFTCVLVEGFVECSLIKLGHPVVG